MLSVNDSPRKPAPQSSIWQNELRDVVTNLDELGELLDLNFQQHTQRTQAIQSFALRVPRDFIARMEKGNLNDPLLKQILPSPDELRRVEGFVADPLLENQQNPHPGLLHKYRGRVLLTFTGRCAINCRFCFRRHFPYENNRPSRLEWQSCLDYINDDPSIEEVILSGGDPLLVDNDYLSDFLDRLSKIPHLKRCRIHSRLPIVLPSRLDDGFLSILSRQRLDMILVCHCNHPNEMDDSVREAYYPLRAFNHLTLLNQSVLMQGINNTVACQITLAQALFSAGILPYYLHLPDKTAGTAHFDVSKSEALTLYRGMIEQLSGYLVPKLVYEQPYACAKVSLSPNF